MRLVILGIVGTVAGLLLGIGIVAADVLPPAASAQAVNTDHVYDIMVIVTMGIFGLVTACWWRRCCCSASAAARRV